MVDKQIFPPRRDETALTGKVLSNRMIVFLEDLASLQSAVPEDIEQAILQTSGSINTANIALSQTKELESSLNSSLQLIAGLISTVSILTAENNQLVNNLNDINQLQTGGFNYGS